VQRHHQTQPPPSQAQRQTNTQQEQTVVRRTSTVFQLQNKKRREQQRNQNAQDSAPTQLPHKPRFMISIKATIKLLGTPTPVMNDKQREKAGHDIYTTLGQVSSDSNYIPGLPFLYLVAKSSWLLDRKLAVRIMNAPRTKGDGRFNLRVAEYGGDLELTLNSPASWNLNGLYR
jgi:hypothetical protein